jgi:Condensation domain
MPVALSEPKKELLQRFLRGTATADNKARGIIRHAGLSEAPVSYGQQQIWLHSQFSSNVQLYNEPVTVHRLGPFDRRAFERAFTEIVRRHEAWRTTFGWKGAELVQRIQPPPGRIEIPYEDVSTVPAEAREEAALKFAAADAMAPFDLAVGPMYRPRLIRFSEEEHRLYLGLHHIIFDGVSLYRVFLPELQALYDAFSQGKPSPLADDLPLQYADYAIWHRQWVETIAPRQLAYWREKLKDVVRRDILPTDHPRTAAPSFRGAMEKLALDAEVSAALKALGRRSGFTLFMTLLATFHLLIWAYTREDDLVIGSTSAGRSRSETDNMLGFFLNTIVLRTDMSGDPTFPELMRRGREELLNSLANDGIPFEQLAGKLAPQREGVKNPFFQVLFSFEPPLAPLQPSWKFTQMDIETGAAKFDLHLELDERPDGIIGRFIYNSDLFERKTIEGMLHTWRNIVHQVVADPERRISELVSEIQEPRRTTLAEQAPPVRKKPAARDTGGIMWSLRKLIPTRKSERERD